MVKQGFSRVTDGEHWSAKGETYVDRANEVFIPHQHVSHCETEENGQNPSADEAFDSLLRR